MSKYLVPVAMVCCLGACNDGSGVSGSPDDAGGPATGGATTTVPTGGAAGAGSGGAAPTGGTSAAGGTPSSGGSTTATGGAKSSGGTTGSGGATVIATGGRTGGSAGQSATGGRTTAGGATGSGGRTGSGGASATGGTSATGGAGSGGRTGSGGSTASGGSGGVGGATAKGGATGSGGSTASSAPACNTTLPASTGKVTTSSTINISGTKDYGMQQICADPNTLGPGDQTENQKAVFMLAANAVLKNVIIGGPGCSAADGVHCESGSCTLENVWFGDVGEDAVSFKGSNQSQVMTITGGGAFSASDKVIQHNGPGTIKITGFYVSDAGKLYRSCGNCGTQYARHVVLDYVTAKSTKSLVGINTNYGDTAKLTHITLCGSGTTVCAKYTGNDTGDEPTSAGSGPDSTNCLYTNSDITQQ